MLVLSLFPGLDLFGMAFELEGFCVVRGPDIIFGQDICNFHPPAGRFDGVIGGPPCQRFSQAGFFKREVLRHPNLIPEFCRCAEEAQPGWWLMENVLRAPDPEIPNYCIQKLRLDAAMFGIPQNRKRAFWFGSRPGTVIQPQMVWPIPEKLQPCVTASESKRGSRTIRYLSGKVRHYPTRPLPERCRLMGLPQDFTIPGYPKYLIGQLIGNGVPIPMGRALAKAVREAVAE